ncbi:dna replication protein [Diplodia corticola]|uniref:Dna replication protein n=1 Tax=Diplodia corticola TaxID=236234 RepID=A0A1J9S6Q5_9PEZI|nr:dna replication protein [Diplodia corticola]OJD40627.1 dna replication protein [Diplodia corticola]
MIKTDDAMSHAPSQNDSNWPPKSPHQALLSSPSGRKRWEQRRRNQPSPSMGSPRTASRASQLLSDGIEGDDNEEEDEDEETLQLKLQAIEARLRLKKLQAAKAKQANTEADEGEGRDIFSPHPLKNAASSDQSRATGRIRAQSNVQVPLSPVKRGRVPLDPTSPARVKLGIDKGLRAQDVSLKRPTFSQDTSNTSSRPSSKARSDRPSSFSGPSGVAARDGALERPKSFSERLAETRLKDNEKLAKDERIQKARSRGFGLGAAERTASSQDGRTPSQLSNGSGSHTFEKPARPSFLRRKQSSSTNNSLDSSANTSRPNSRHRSASQTSATTDPPPRKNSSFSGLPESTADDGASFEPFTGIHLSRRLLPHNIITRAFDQKELYPLPRLLATVKGPDYDPPDHEADFVVLGVIASKSTPRDLKNMPKAASTADPDDDDGPNKSKFMVLHLTDFKWEIDLFLFGTAFTTFWKLTPGTLIAILNPGIFPPRDKRTGQFSLKIGSSEDTILEIGNARDLGFCKSVKKDGQECGSWIDKRKTEFCEYHVYLQVEKSKRGRMEVNTMAGFGKGLSGKNGAGPAETNKQYDSYLHETMYVLPKHMSGRSAAARLDHDEDAINRGMSREDLHRKRLAEKERERELADKLSRIGGKAGSEYMRAKAAGRPDASSTADSSRNSSRQTSAAGAAGAYNTPFNRLHDGPDPVDAASLGLLGKRAADVSLNPIKRKRTATLGGGGGGGGGDGSQATTVASSSYSARHTAEPMGWGGANKRELLLSPSKKKLVGSSGTRRIDDMLRRDGDPRQQQQQQQQLQSPALQSPRGVLHLPERSRSREGSPKKKARLMIEGKGIREPGRESMGSAAVVTKATSSDDDDLEII